MLELYIDTSHLEEVINHSITSGALHIMTNICWMWL